METTPWMDYAKALVGTTEIKGSKHNPEIKQADL